jgi:hypothetical protein
MSTKPRSAARPNHQARRTEERRAGIQHRTGRCSGQIHCRPARRFARHVYRSLYRCERAREVFCQQTHREWLAPRAKTDHSDIRDRSHAECRRLPQDPRRDCGHFEGGEYLIRMPLDQLADPRPARCRRRGTCRRPVAPALKLACFTYAEFGCVVDSAKMVRSYVATSR